MKLLPSSLSKAEKGIVFFFLKKSIAEFLAIVNIQVLKLFFLSNFFKLDHALTNTS